MQESEKGVKLFGTYYLAYSFLICVLEQSGTKVLEEIGKKSHVVDKKVMIKPHQIQINYDFSCDSSRLAGVHIRYVLHMS